MDLNESLTRARRILNSRWRRALPNLLLPVSAYIASVTTISLAWFNRSGSFRFDKNSWLDWTFAGVLLLVLVAGAWQIWREIKHTRGITVNRDELSDLMTLARNDATHSVVISRATSLGCLRIAKGCWRSSVFTHQLSSKSTMKKKLSQITFGPSSMNYHEVEFDLFLTPAISHQDFSAC